MATKTTKANKANKANKGISVQYIYRPRGSADVYECKGHFDPATLTVDGMSPTQAAKAMTDGACGSVNGWRCWTTVKAVRLRGKSFLAGTSISDLRETLNVPVRARTVTTKKTTKTPAKKTVKRTVKKTVKKPRRRIKKTAK